jgi:membrane protease YdiL (CAAX protease family)
LASFGAAALTGAMPAVRDLLSRLVRVRVGVRWYAAALLVPPATAAAALAVAGLVGSGSTAPSTSVGAVAGLLVFNAGMWLLTEETAWRGFALPRLEQRFAPVTASVLLGLVWAAWHLPLFLVAGTFQSTIPFGGFLISTVATSVLIGTVFDGGRGSVLIAALCHAATDVTIATTGVMTSGAVLFWVFVTLQVVTALGCVPVLLRVAPGVCEGVGREVEPSHA